MFGRFKKKTELEKLEGKVKKLIKEAYSLSLREQSLLLLMYLGKATQKELETIELKHNVGNR